ncbi:hypothetical protein QJS04_geneDACA017598 [Acorus gramineus]|uniref:Uncharacterized protein n=1 Tax=Acorus gramineus TaxID=55184 RepID=A0AAV9AYP2_ACOGR|nr:hypothetical protein QJS04_geneDACA017598 [Acorus gramineus]
MEEGKVDMVLVPIGLTVMGLYHLWLFIMVKHLPKKTVIGLNAIARHRWVLSMISDPSKNGVLAVQTIRNNIMASTVLATTAITLTSLIGVFVSSSPSSSTTSSLIYGNRSKTVLSIKYFSILLCFLLAFLCNVQSIRYYAHVSFLVSVPVSRRRRGGEAVVSAEYVSRSLNRGSVFWSVGLRAFYASFVLFLWIFGPIPMLIGCVSMTGVLYFLDTTTGFTRDLHEMMMCVEEEEMEDMDLESHGVAGL